MLMLAVGCEKTTVQGPGGQAMTISTPRSVAISRGETRALSINVDRKNFDDPVRVSIAQLPEGVSADRTTKTIETDAATFMLSAAPTATMVVNQQVRITVAGGDMRATEYFALTVK
jgi:hypothetical protein